MISKKWLVYEIPELKSYCSQCYVFLFDWTSSALSGRFSAEYVIHFFLVYPWQNAKNTKTKTWKPWKRMLDWLHYTDSVLILNYFQNTIFRTDFNLFWFLSWKKMLTKTDMFLWSDRQVCSGQQLISTEKSKQIKISSEKVFWK